MLQRPAGFHNKKWSEMKKKKKKLVSLTYFAIIIKRQLNTVLEKWMDEYQRYFPVFMKAC